MNKTAFWTSDFQISTSCVGTFQVYDLTKRNELFCRTVEQASYSDDPLTGQNGLMNQPSIYGMVIKLNQGIYI